MTARLLQIRMLAMVLALFFSLGAQPYAARPATRVGVLLSSDAPPFTRALAGFKAQLQSRRPAVEYVTHFLGDVGMASDEDALSRWDQEADLILALGSAALERTLRTNDDGPFVVSMVLRKRDIRQGDNVTGIALEFPLNTHFYWMQRLLPEARRIGVIYTAEENGALIDKAARIARKRGLELVPREISSARDIPAALDSLTNSADALWGISDRIVMTPQTAKALLLFSFRNRIPFIGLSEPWVKAGALYALERDYLDIGKQCAELADKILSGKPVESLPPEFPRQVTYMINLRTVEQMKIDIPDHLRRQAKKLY